MALIKSVKGKKLNKVKTAILIEGVFGNCVLYPYCLED